MEEKLVTVVIPTHAGQENIARAVESVLNQSYRNIEAIVVDDNGKGSANQKETEAAVASLLADGRVQYIAHETNQNGSVARNTAMKVSRGEYIAFLDDDDVYYPDCIAAEVAALEKLPPEYGMVFVSFIQTQEGMPDKVWTADFDGDVLRDFLLGKIESPSSIVMIRREIMDTVGLWDESFRRHQDWEYFTRILRKYKAYGVQTVYVERPVSMRHVAANPERFKENRIHYMEKMKQILEEQPQKTQKTFCDRHYGDIGKEYFKKGQLKESFHWAKKTRFPFKTVCGYGVDGGRYVWRRLWGRK